MKMRAFRVVVVTICNYASLTLLFSFAAIQNLRYDLLFGGGFEKQVDEASACDFRFFHVRR